MSHDARGNITAIAATGYGYDVENWMTYGWVQSQLYPDPAGRLIRTVGAADTRFAWDGNDLALELDPSGNVLRRYVHGPGMDEPLIWYEGSGTADRRWLHADERGSVIAVSNGSGSAILTYSFDEYGVPGGGVAGRFGYTGQLWLPELGAYYYKARIYNPALGRFMQTDPIGYGDGLNLYGYVKGDPVNFVDPTGTQDEFPVFGYRSSGGTFSGVGGLSPGTGYVGDGGSAFADDPETINIIRSLKRAGRSATGVFSGVIYFPAPGSSITGGSGSDEGLVVVTGRRKKSFVCASGPGCSVPWTPPACNLTNNFCGSLPPTRAPRPKGRTQNMIPMCAMGVCQTVPKSAACKAYSGVSDATKWPGHVSFVGGLLVKSSVVGSGGGVLSGVTLAADLGAAATCN